jgi:hypothetical protein
MARWRRKSRPSAAKKIRRIEIPQQQVGVGNRRLSALPAVAGRSRIGAGRIRPNLQQPEGVDAGD